MEDFLRTFGICMSFEEAVILKLLEQIDINKNSKFIHIPKVLKKSSIYLYRYFKYLHLIKTNNTSFIEDSNTKIDLVNSKDRVFKPEI
jgi:hypothetical protein